MRTAQQTDLEETLQAASDEQRKQYFRLWGLTGETYKNIKEYLEKVFESLEEPICARFVWEYLSSDERQILYHVMSYSARDGIQRDALQKKSQLSPERYEPALNSLLQQLLLFEKKGKPTTPKRGNKVDSKTTSIIYPFDDYLTTLYNIGREIFTPLGDRSKKSFTELVTELDTEILYEIYQTYHIKWGKYYTRSDFATMIATSLSRLDEPLDFLPDLEDDTRAIYQWLRQQGGSASMQDVRTHSKLSDNALAVAIYELESNVLAFDTLTREQRTLFIPHDIFAHLKPIESYTIETNIKPEVLVVPEDFVPLAVRHSEMTMVYDIAYVINTIYQQTIEPTQVGRVPKRISTKIRPQLHGQVRPDYQYDDNYLEMLLEISKEIRLLRLSKSTLTDTKEHYEPGEQLSWWSHLDLTGQAAYLLRQWKSSFRWEDLPGIYYRAWDPYSWKPISGREILLSYLTKRTPGRWYTIASLLQELWEEDAFVMHPQQTYGRKTERRKTKEVREKWDRCDGETYIGMLASTLYELGIVDLGYDRLEALEMKQRINPSTFMLTATGASVLPRIDEDLPVVNSGERALIVQPSFELLLLQPDMPTLYSILPFTQLNQAGMVSRLTLNRASLLRALAIGNNIEQILQTLEKISQKTLPQNVVYSLNDWSKSYKGTKISQVLLFEVSSENVANELNTSTKFTELGLRQLSPFVFAMSGDVHLKQLKQTLEKEGIIVQISGNIITALHH